MKEKMVTIQSHGKSGIKTTENSGLDAEKQDYRVKFRVIPCLPWLIPWVSLID
ncbi:MAG: hypothetical protein LBG27_05840 [Spirochaetaceae bacterium]|jgi:hypothetical protein|nr:hypothetical protein [Spirochaetaceae bacterium]